MTFNRGLKPLLSLFSDRDIEEIFQILNAYFVAFRNGVLSVFNAEALLANPTLFLAICGFLQPVARIVKDRFKGDYSVDNFYDVLKPVGETVKKGVITKPGGAYRPILDHLNECLQSSFTL